MTLNPDLVFRGRNAIADLKYKVSDGAWKRPDLYQAIAFAEGFQVTNAALIEFDLTAAPTPPDIAVGDIRLRHISWDCGADSLPSDAAHALVSDVSCWLAILA
jgi:hypothetical protein